MPAVVRVDRERARPPHPRELRADLRRGETNDAGGWRRGDHEGRPAAGNLALSPCSDGSMGCHQRFTMPQPVPVPFTEIQDGIGNRKCLIVQEKRDFGCNVRFRPRRPVERSFARPARRPGLSAHSPVAVDAGGAADPAALILGRSRGLATTPSALGREAKPEIQTRRRERGCTDVHLDCPPSACSFGSGLACGAPE
jgi:hypothetical protein